MFFRDVIGQEEIKQRLIQEVSEGRIPHAQLICGPEGVGKMPLAIAYARYISCTNRGETDACGVCPSCVKFNKLVHPDVHFVFPIVKSAKGKKEVCDDYIADWRHLVLSNPYFSLNHWLNEMGAENGQAIIYAKESDEITRKLSLKSSEGGYKVTIVWLPEKLHEVCANKLLKLLEEPPEKTIFLLVSEAPELIEKLVKVDTTGQFLASTARYLSAVDREQFEPWLAPLIEAAIDKDRERRYIGSLLQSIWGADYMEHAAELRITDNNFRRIFKRIHPEGEAM